MIEVEYNNFIIISSLTILILGMFGIMTKGWVKKGLLCIDIAYTIFYVISLFCLPKTSTIINQTTFDYVPLNEQMSYTIEKHYDYPITTTYYVLMIENEKEDCLNRKNYSKKNTTVVKDDKHFVEKIEKKIDNGIFYEYDTEYVIHAKNIVK